MMPSYSYADKRDTKIRDSCLNGVVISICILFIFGQIRVATIRIWSNYLKPLYGSALVVSEMSKIK